MVNKKKTAFCRMMLVILKLFVSMDEFIIITDRISSMGEGYVFTGVCLFTGGWPTWTGGVASPWEADPQTAPPPTVNRRSVRILLECILV